VALRKSINALAARVPGVLGLDPFCAPLFALTHRGCDKGKMVYWEGSGFGLGYKRLEQARFAWPRAPQSRGVTLTGPQLNGRLEGYDLRYLTPHAPLEYKTV
jgi:transposase